MKFKLVSVKLDDSFLVLVSHGTTASATKTNSNTEPGDAYKQSRNEQMQ